MMATRAHAIMLVAVAFCAGCGSRAPQESRAPQKPYFVPIAEGLTSPTLAENIRVAPRMFSAPELVKVCGDPRTVARLETVAGTLGLQVGERFALSSLRIVAVNAADEAMLAAPIAIEAEDASPPVLQLRSDNPELQKGQLYPLNAGRFRLRIRTLCGTPGAETTIVGRADP
jgi:hypothetical protein